VVIFTVRRMDVRFEQRVNIKFCVKLGKTATDTLQLVREAYGDEAFSQVKKGLKGWRTAAFRTCRNIGNSVLAVKGTTSKGTGSISCKFEFCIF
jgi:hypothetical protein